MCDAIARDRAPAPARSAIGFAGADGSLSQALAWYDYAGG